MRSKLAGSLTYSQSLPASARRLVSQQRGCMLTAGLPTTSGRALDHHRCPGLLRMPAALPCPALSSLILDLHRERAPGSGSVDTLDNCLCPISPRCLSLHYAPYLSGSILAPSVRACSLPCNRSLWLPCPCLLPSAVASRRRRRRPLGKCSQPAWMVPTLPCSAWPPPSSFSLVADATP